MHRIAVSPSVDRFTCRNFSTPDIAIDLGTAYLRACSTEASKIFEVPSQVENGGGERLRPLTGGVIVDADAATKLLKIALQRFRTWHSRPPNVLATVPSDASAEEQETVLQSLYRAGAGMVAILPEPVAAAVGASLHHISGSRMLVDVGEGVTDIAVLAHGALCYRTSIRLGCAEMRDCVIAAASREGVVLTRGDADSLLRRGTGGALARVAPTAEFSRAAATAAVDTIAAFVSHAYRELDAPTKARVRSYGICLTGGGALTRGVRSAVAARLGVPTFRAPNPLRSVIAGTRKLLGGEARHVWDGFPAS